MDAFEEGIRRLKGELDNLKQLIPQNGDGEVAPIVPPPGNPNMAIAGAEVTQAIQFYAQGSGGGPPNSLPLVLGKTTVLRVEIDVSNRNPNFPVPATVTGEIQYSGVNFGDPDSNPINGPIDARPAGLFNRGNANETLNFRVPAWRTDIPGVLMRLYDPAHPGGGLRYTSSLRNIPIPIQRLYVPFGPQITDYRLRLVCVRIIYTGPGAASTPLGPVTVEQVTNTLSSSPLTKTYPISGINYIGFPVVEFDGDLRVEPTGWLALLQLLRDMRSAAGSTDVYLGLLPDGVQRGPTVSGYGGSDGVAAAFLEVPTIAHELGHAYGDGRDHAPCGLTAGDRDLDPRYPPCGTFPAGSICEFGFGTEFSTVFPPDINFDFMNVRGRCPAMVDPVSGALNWWISPYTWLRLRNAIYTRDWIRHPTAASPVAPREAAVERQYLHLNFRMYRDGSVDLLPSFHLSRPVPEAEGGPRAPVAFELRDARRQVLGFYPCHITDPNADPDSPYLVYHKTVPWEDPWESETRTIAFFRDGEEVAEVEVEEQAPEIRVTAFDADRNRMRLEWEGQHETKSITYLVRYSNDGGQNWLGLAAGLTEPKFVVDDLDALPGGDSCVFQIVASSTIRTTVAETEPVSVPVKPRRPYIVSPEPDTTSLQGESVTLAGLGHSPDFETAPLDEVVWTSNVAGFLGYGYEVITNTLAPGLHKITLSVPDGLGGEVSADVRIRINPAEDTINREEE
jgi:hypothetical protein